MFVYVYIYYIFFSYVCKRIIGPRSAHLCHEFRRFISSYRTCCYTAADVDDVRATHRYTHIERETERERDGQGERQRAEHTS